MKKLFASLILSSLALLNYAQSSKDDEEITRVATAFFNSWNKHDFSDVPNYTTEDVSFVIGSGALWKGRNQFQKGHENVHKSLFKNTSFIPDQQTISTRFITPDVAITNMVAKLGAFYPPDGVDRGNNKQGDERVMITMVEIKKAGTWLLTAAQGTAIIHEAEAMLQKKD
jgi:uncharacterized protein (TIGR02246 family)